MPDRGDERGRGGTRTLVTGILAGTEWHPAESPQEATQTARDARDLAVRLRPVLSKLAQAPRGGRRRDLDWLPAVEQLAVDAQYFASWWLPRLEGKSAGSWPSWSADGYADWVKRLDAQRVRTLEMVENSVPAPRGMASVTQLRRGKNAPEEPEEAPEVTETSESAAEESVEATAAAAATESADPAEATEAEEPPARHARSKGRRLARIMPIRGSGAPVVDAGSAAFEDFEDSSSGAADETHITRIADGPSAPDAEAPEGIFEDYDDVSSGGADETHITRIVDGPTVPEAEVPQTPPNTGPGIFEDHDDSPPAFDADETPIALIPSSPEPTGFEEFDHSADDTHISLIPPSASPTGFEDLEDFDHSADEIHVPRTPPNPGPPISLFPEAEVLHIPRTPPNTGPDTFDDYDTPSSGSADETHVARIPQTGFEEFEREGTHTDLPAVRPISNIGRSVLDELAAEDDLMRVPSSKPRPVPPPAPVPAPPPAEKNSAGADLFFIPRTPPNTGPAEDVTAPPPLFRDEVAIGPDEFENFRPGTDLPPPIFTQSAATEPVDRGRIARFAVAGLLAAAGCVLVVYAVNQKGSDKSAAPPVAATSSSAATTPAANAGSQSSAAGGAVTPPTATDSTGVSSSSSTSSAPAAAPPPPASTSGPAPASSSASASKSPAAPPPSSAAPPPSTRPPAGGGGGGGGVSSLSVGGLAPDQAGSYTYTAHVHVVTRGTGSVTVTVTFAGSQSGESPGSTGAQSQSFTLSGKTAYDLSPGVDVHGMCNSPYIDVVASASGASSAVSFATSPC